MRWPGTHLWKAIVALLLFAAAGAIAIYEHQVVDPAFERVTTDFQNVPMSDLPSILHNGPVA
jgi:hypothetical protein